MNCLMCYQQMKTKPRVYCRSCNTCAVCGARIGERAVMPTGELAHVECAARETKRQARVERLKAKGCLS